MEIDVEKFAETLYEEYQHAVKKQAADLLRLEYDQMLTGIHEIQEALEQHQKIFDDKAFL